MEIRTFLLYNNHKRYTISCISVYNPVAGTVNRTLVVRFGTL